MFYAINTHGAVLKLTCFTIFFSGLLCVHNSSYAQVYSDTLKLNIPQAEEIFIQKNLTLLANQYNIDINKALVQQAKVWDNPVVNTATNLYDGKFFRHGKAGDVYYGQYYAQVQQLIRTAGKLKKQSQLALDNVVGAEAQFAELMRNLKFALTTAMNNMAQLQNIAALYKAEMQTMQKLVHGMDEMYKVGDISEKDNTRIKALLFSLQNDYNQNLQQQTDLNKDIAILLQLKDDVWVKADAGKSFSQSEIDRIILKDLMDSALQQRPDLAYAKNQSVYQQHNIAFQKAQAVPDVTVGLDWDHNSSYARNVYGISASLPIPLFNKNKGNIRAAELAYKQNNVQLQQLTTQVNSEVAGAYQKLLTATSIFNEANKQLESNYEKLLQNMMESYRQRHVSLLEFIDFFESYRDTRIKQWGQINSQRNAAAELNFTTNQNIIKL